jgi:hypothetical protein
MENTWISPDLVSGFYIARIVEENKTGIIPLVKTQSIFEKIM